MNSPEPLSESFVNNLVGVDVPLTPVTNWGEDFVNQSNDTCVGGSEGEETGVIEGSYLECNLLDRTPCVLVNNLVPWNRSREYFPNRWHIRVHNLAGQ